MSGMSQKLSPNVTAFVILPIWTRHPGSSIPEDMLDLEVEENPSSSVVEDQSDDDLSPEQSLAEDYTPGAVHMRLPPTQRCAMSRTARSLIYDFHKAFGARRIRAHDACCPGARTGLAGGRPFDLSLGPDRTRSLTPRDRSKSLAFRMYCDGGTNHHQSGR